VTLRQSPTGMHVEEAPLGALPAEIKQILEEAES
jgi:hypothetical protein